MTRIGVLSDTHGHRINTQNAITVLESHQVEWLIHCGDIGCAEIIHLLSAWPVHYVQGNVDRNSVAHFAEVAEKQGSTWHGEFGSLNLEGKRIAFLHGDDQKLLHNTVESGEWNLVCHGHTHQARLERRGCTTILNPGAVFRANPHTVAIIQTVPEADWEIIHHPI